MGGSGAEAFGPVFETSSFALSPRFPGVRLESFEAFRAYQENMQDELDGRFGYERALAVRGASFRQAGTCAPCLRATEFTCETEGGEVLADGRVVPNWRETMSCDCEDALPSRQRALLHFAQAGGLLPWTRLLIFGPTARMDARLAAQAGDTVVTRPPGRLMEDAFHLVVSHDYLHTLPGLDEALNQLRTSLLAGGRFLFTVPFHHGLAASELSDTERRLGWDLLDRLRQAGFRDAAAYVYWSEELGYLGTMSFVFRAVK